MRPTEREPPAIFLFDRSNVLSRRRPFPLVFLWLALAIAASATIIDRVSVSVGNRVITASELDRQIRVTAFQNGVKPDFSPAARRATADRMVEQKLIQRELSNS